jgi:hypothetical protein
MVNLSQPMPVQHNSSFAAGAISGQLFTTPLELDGDGFAGVSTTAP